MFVYIYIYMYTHVYIKKTNTTRCSALRGSRTQQQAYLNNTNTYNKQLHYYLVVMFVIGLNTTTHI